MLQVGLETSDRDASLAIRHDGELEEWHVDPANAHASDCLALAAKWFETRPCTPRDIDLVLVGTGPGSYTGLRIGVATALGLARGAGARLRGVPSGEVLCWRELDVGEQAVVLLDARQGELYFAHYAREAQDVRVIVPACVCRHADLRRLLPSEVPIFGDAGALELAGLQEQEGHRFRATAPPGAGALVELGARRVELHGAHGLDEVEPLYLRPFAAKTRRR